MADQRLRFSFAGLVGIVIGITATRTMDLFQAASPSAEVAAVSSEQSQSENSLELDLNIQPQSDANNTLIDRPLIATDTDLSLLYEQQPVQLRWETVAGADGYRVQISQQADFAEIHTQAKTGTQQWSVPASLEPAIYYWRVQAIVGSRQSAWSGVGRITIRPMIWQHPIAMRIPYTPDSPWNTPIAAQPIYDAHSADMIATLRDTSTGGRIGSDTSRYTFPVYYADATTPRYDIPCMRWSCTHVEGDTLSRVTMLRGVPIPDGAAPSSGNDQQMIVIDVESGIEYGFFQLRRTDSGWEASNGYRYPVDGAGTAAGFGSRGAGVPYSAGLIRAWEIRQGEIRHALAFAYEHAAARGCVYPASQTDGKSTLPFAIPQGARLQLNPALTDADFDRMNLSRAGKIIARALQVYGMFLIDSGGSPKIMAEDLTANLLYPFSWDDPDLGYTKEVISNLPYDQFRVLALPDAYWQGSSPTFGNCVK